MVMKAVHTEGLFRTSDGLILFEQRWLQPVSSRGAVVLVHGYAEHSGRYKQLARKLADEGFSVFAYDHRGHGKSEGLRAFVPSFALLVDDLARYLGEVRRLQQKIFVLGHSMGGAVLAHFAAEPTLEIAGAVFSSPALALEKKYPFPVRLFSRASARFFPGWGLPGFVYRLETDALSRNQQVVDEYRRDPFVYHGPMLNRTGWELYCAVARMPKLRERIRIPFLALHGEADRLTNPEGTTLLLEQAGSTDKTLKRYPEAYHELFNDLCGDAVWRDLRDWLCERTERRGPEQAPETATR